MTIEQFYLGGLGHQSYLISDPASGQAAVVDPRRDSDIYVEAAAAQGVRITHILETHIHNDYVTGARELAARTGAQIVTSAAGNVAYADSPVRDNDRVQVGTLTFTVLATPGHTPEHVSYALTEAGQTHPTAVFTGGSMLVGGAGRTDLLGAGMTLTLTREQYRSLRRLLETLPGHVLVYPTHGAGSFCGASAITPTRFSTIAQEWQASPAVTARSEDDFVQRQLAGYGAYPTYYAFMHAINQQGPRVLGRMPEPPSLAPQVVQQHIAEGMPLVDGRSREAFAAAHIPGTLNIELNDDFATYVGWVLPFNAPLLILIEDEAGRREAVVQLVRIGYEQVTGYVDGGIAAWESAALPLEHYDRIDVPELARRLQRGEPLTVVDVRRPEEWQAGHISGSIHAHLGDLPHLIDGLPTATPLAVICRTGHRASIGASMIAASGRQVLAVQGGMPDWIAAGLPSEVGATDAAAAHSDPAHHAHP
jgi:hydroxyacylglutathione hydrolase